MPTYVYKCSDCGFIFESNHSIKEKLRDCQSCNIVDSLKRLPSSFSVKKATESAGTAKAGDLTKEKINEFKQELKDQKKKLKSQEYEE